MLGSAYIDLESFSEELFSGASDAREKFDKKMQMVGLIDGEKIEVDPQWVSNKMKTGP